MSCMFSPQLERKVIREEEAVGNIKHELNEVSSCALRKLCYCAYCDKRQLYMQTLDCLNQAQKLLLETEDKKAEVVM